MNRQIVRFVGRALLFTAVCVLAYVAVLFAAVNARKGGVRGLWHTNIPSEKDIYGGQSSFVLAEIGDYRDIDILWIGSSHAYRTFDPRFFDQFGLRTFNLGTTAQTPLNTFSLLRRHLERLRPKLVVMELYWMALSWDGVESALDLVANSPSLTDLMPMVTATREIRVLNALLRRVLDLRRPPLSDVQPNLLRDDTYIGRGFVEKPLGFEASRDWEPGPIELCPKQLKYVEHIIELVRESNIEIVLVVQPLPSSTLGAIFNRREIERTLRELAERNGVAYVDFNGRLPLDDRRHFFDSHHLNQAGLREFLPELLSELHRLGAVKQGEPQGPPGRSW